MNKMKRPGVAEAQRALDLIVSKSGKLKSQIETVQCMALEVRLDLMDDDTEQTRMMRALQPIVDELASLVESIAALSDGIRTASMAGRPRLQ
jgi:predicted N-formylglutamate amidohydrolase